MNFKRIGDLELSLVLSCPFVYSCFLEYPIRIILTLSSIIF